MLTKLFTVGMWSALIPVAVTAICPDGKIRKFRTAQSPDTFFSIPCRGNINGISIRGYVSHDDGEYHFHPYKYHPNYARLTK